jgi:2-oxoglutarate dehydrogenase E1 component
MLRRQALIEKRRPLIIFTPKSLLRNQQSFAPFRELATGKLQRIIDDPYRSKAREKVQRLLLCTGRIYYDLVGSDLYRDNERVALARMEVLYPFPQEQLIDLIAHYPNLTEIAWVQEEPKNMGARRFMFTRARERELMPEGVKLGYYGRPYRASPGEGYSAAHAAEQQRIITEALTLN